MWNEREWTVDYDDFSDDKTPRNEASKTWELNKIYIHSDSNRFNDLYFFFYSNNISHQKYSWRITLGKIESLTDGKIKSLWSSKCYKVNRKPSRRMGPSINFDVFFEMDKPCDTLLRIFLLKVSLNCKISMQFDDSENCYFFSMLWIQICRISYATLGVYQ